MDDFTLLVAEDESDIRNMIVEFFKFKGFNVVGVPDGAEAVKYARELMPDLIVLDVRMPNMTGFEACEILKAEEETNPIPIVFLSAYGQQDNVATGLQLGAEEYISKPIELDDLGGRVHKILSKYGKTM